MRGSSGEHKSVGILWWSAGILWWYSTDDVEVGWQHDERLDAKALGEGRELAQQRDGLEMASSVRAGSASCASALA